MEQKFELPQHLPHFIFYESQLACEIASLHGLKELKEMETG